MTRKRVTDARKAYREYLRRTANRPVSWLLGIFQGRLPCRHSCIKVIVPEELTRKQIENMMEPESACAWVAGSALRPQMFQELCRLALLGLGRTPTPAQKAPSADTVGKADALAEVVKAHELLRRAEYLSQENEIQRAMRRREVENAEANLHHAYAALRLLSEGK